MELTRNIESGIMDLVFLVYGFDELALVRAVGRNWGQFVSTLSRYMAISINQARKILGSGSKKYSDEYITALLSQFYGIAEIVADVIEKSGSKNEFKGIDGLNLKGDNNYGYSK